MRIYVLRHAHADPAGPHRPDADRTLSIRGEAWARRLAKDFAAGIFGPPPARILASPARRTLQTAEAIATELAAPLTPDTRLGLRAELEDLVQLARELACGLDRSPALLVGHNPTVSEAAVFWCRGFSPPPEPFEPGHGMAFDANNDAGHPWRPASRVL